MGKEDTQPAGRTEEKKPWHPPELTPVGSVSDVLQGGTGKVTVIVGDPGEPQKVPSMDM
jgi:hypothetical protein